MSQGKVRLQILVIPALPPLPRVGCRDGCKLYCSKYFSPFPSVKDFQGSFLFIVTTDYFVNDDTLWGIEISQK